MSAIGVEPLVSRASRAGWSGEVEVGPRRLQGRLNIPAGARGVIGFAHGRWASRNSPRNIRAAERLGGAHFGTLLFDLLTDSEAYDRRNVFNIPMLAGRIIAAIDWLGAHPISAKLPIGLFGAGTGAAAAIVAAAGRPRQVKAVVSRGGRPDLGSAALERLSTPTLLIVGGADVDVLQLNWQAMQRMRCESSLQVVRNAGHLFEEPGALNKALDHAANWFSAHLLSENLA